MHLFNIFGPVDFSEVNLELLVSQFFSELGTVIQSSLSLKYCLLLTAIEWLSIWFLLFNLFLLDEQTSKFCAYFIHDFSFFFLNLLLLSSLQNVDVLSHFGLVKYLLEWLFNYLWAIFRYNKILDLTNLFCQILWTGYPVW